MEPDPSLDHKKEKQPNTLATKFSSDEDRVKWSDMGKNTTHMEKTTAATLERQSRRQRMLANEDIRRWYLNQAATSRENADVSIRRLGKFCEDHNMTPMQFIELAMRDTKAATDMLADHINAMVEADRAPNYQKKILTTMRSWMDHFGLKTTRKIRIRNVSSTPTLENERVPEGEELAEVFNRCSMRTGAIVSLVSKGGLRLKVLGNEDATDGLMMKDLPDIGVIQGKAVCLRSPPMILVRKTLSKAGHQYFTFLTTQATKKLIAYLNDRIAKGEPISADSSLIAPDSEHRYGRGKNSSKKFLKRIHIARLIREEAFRPRFTWRPYVLRPFFDTQLLIAESKGKVAHDFRVFWMGHKGSIEAVYTTNKGRLPEPLVNEMREAFKRSEEFLDLEVKSEDPLLKQKDQLQNAIANATPEKVQEMLRLLGICNT